MSAADHQKACSDPCVLTLRGRLVRIRRPWVMGILNLTPDSFHASSRVATARDAVERAGRMLADGADILDVGACSTRPGAVPPSPEEEMSRLGEPLGRIREAFPDALVSVDTFRASVARECLARWNVDIINDVSGGTDPAMFETVANHRGAYVLTHSRGNSAQMDSLCSYDDVVADVTRELAFRLSEAREAGICDVIVDPGFGFAKTEEQNFRLLKNLDFLKVLGCPILAGISRKRMTRGEHEASSPQALAATIALDAVALLKGASIIRVHDVREGAVTAKTISKLWDLT